MQIFFPPFSLLFFFFFKSNNSNRQIVVFIGTRKLLRLLRESDQCEERPGNTD